MAKITANLEASYNFVEVFFSGAVNFAITAKTIEQSSISNDEATQICLANATASIMQSVAALEAESWNLLNKGPGHNLGSNGIDINSKQILNVVSEYVEKTPNPERFNAILKLLGKETIDKGSEVYQHAELVVFLRNEITHYKSKSTSEVDRQKRIKSLQSLKLTKSTVYGHKTYRHIPLIQMLGYACAKWSYVTILDFLDVFYKKLEVKSPIIASKDALK